MRYLHFKKTYFALQLTANSIAEVTSNQPGYGERLPRRGTFIRLGLNSTSSTKRAKVRPAFHSKCLLENTYACRCACVHFPSS